MQINWKLVGTTTCAAVIIFSLFRSLNQTPSITAKPQFRGDEFPYSSIVKPETLPAGWTYYTGDSQAKDYVKLDNKGVFKFEQSVCEKPGRQEEEKCKYFSESYHLKFVHSETSSVVDFTLMKTKSPEIGLEFLRAYQAAIKDKQDEINCVGKVYYSSDNGYFISYLQSQGDANLSATLLKVINPPEEFNILFECKQ